PMICLTHKITDRLWIPQRGSRGLAHMAQPPPTLTTSPPHLPTHPARPSNSKRDASPANNRRHLLATESRDSSWASTDRRRILLPSVDPISRSAAPHRFR